MTKRRFIRLYLESIRRSTPAPTRRGHAALTRLHRHGRVALPHRSLLDVRALLVGARRNRSFAPILGTSAQNRYPESAMRSRRLNADQGVTTAGAKPMNSSRRAHMNSA
jgi:hypothetical protein